MLQFIGLCSRVSSIPKHLVWKNKKSQIKSVTNQFLVFGLGKNYGTEIESFQRNNQSNGVTHISLVFLYPRK